MRVYILRFIVSILFTYSERRKIYVVCYEHKDLYREQFPWRKNNQEKFEQWSFLCDVFETKLRENEGA